MRFVDQLRRTAGDIRATSEDVGVTALAVRETATAATAAFAMIAAVAIVALVISVFVLVTR